jgi:peptidyl-prolyl cis-trans isomerase C
MLQVSLNVSIQKFLTRILLLLFVPLWLGGSVAAEDAENPQTLVVVNNDTITTADVDKQVMGMHRRLSAEQIATFDYDKLLQKLINDRLLLQEALAIGMHEEDVFVDELLEIQRDRARRTYVRDTFKPDIDVSDEEVETRFKSFYFKIQLRTLAVASLEEAEELKGMIEDGAPMDSIAQAQSLDSRKFKGGLHSLKYWRDVPIILRLAAQDLAPGEMSDPFKFQESWMFVRVEQRLDPNLDEMEPWSKEIRTILANTKRDVAWRNFLDSLGEIFPQRTDATLLAKIKADSAVLFRGEFLRGSDETVIHVGQLEEVTENELRRKMSHEAMNAGDQVFDTILFRASASIVQKIRLSAAAQQQGFMSHEAVLKFVAKTRDSLLLENYLGENVLNRIAFNHQEFQQYYAANLDDFRESDEVQLKALQASSESEADEAADNLADGADFDHVASQLGREGGIDHDENEWFSVSTFPTGVAANLDEIDVGKYTRPFELADGWVIFQLKVRRPGEVKTIEEVDGQIRKVMFQRKFDQLLDELIMMLKESSVIEYNQKVIDAYFGADI